MNILETAKTITREHSAKTLAEIAAENLGPKGDLRHLVMDALRECEKKRLGVWQSGDLITGRILDKFHVEVKNGNS